jgi:hypothetical protein
MDFIDICIEKGFIEKKNKKKVLEEYLIQLQNMKQKPQIEELCEKEVSNKYDLEGGPTHWLIRIGDGIHFKSSSKKSIWGMSTTNNTNVQSFLKKAKKGDLLWFIIGGSNGRVLAMSEYISNNKRELGPLIALTYTNEELGWTESDGDWDYEVHYTNMYIVEKLDLQTEIKAATTVRKYNDKCKVDLPEEYKNIVKYSMISKSFD